MEVLLIILAVIAAGAAVVHFLNSSWGVQVVHKQTVSNILNGVNALQRSAPQPSLEEIYYAVTGARNNECSGLLNSITCTRYGMLDVSIRDRHHHLSNLLKEWRAWRKRFDFAQVG